MQISLRKSAWPAGAAARAQSAVFTTMKKGRILTTWPDQCNNMLVMLQIFRRNVCSAKDLIYKELLNIIIKQTRQNEITNTLSDWDGKFWRKKTQRIVVGKLVLNRYDWISRVWARPSSNNWP